MPAVISIRTTDLQLSRIIEDIAQEIGCQFVSGAWAPHHAIHFAHCETLDPLPDLPCDLSNVMVISEVYDGRQFQRWLGLGARDCLTRPLHLGHLERAIYAAVARRNAEPSGQSDGTRAPHRRGWLERAQFVAPMSTTVLIVGMTGVGKNHLARQIHAWSGRSGPLVTVNCGALAENLIESELFGHASGAFTGAQRSHRGVFQQAARGTLMLDEVNSLPIHLQSRLLQVVEERELTPVGGEQRVPFEGRLLVSSNEPLELLVANGRFREDLYYRLNVVRVEIPPLRERRDEILPLFYEMLDAAAGREGVASRELTAAAQQRLLSYHWPGNIRQLKNAAEYVIAYSAAPAIELDELPEEIVRGFDPRGRGDPGPRTPQPLGDQVPETGVLSGRIQAPPARSDRQFTASEVRQALTESHNNRSAAARALGVSRTTLYKWLRQYNLL